MKPTHGLVADDGLVFLARRLDSIGPLARSVGDLAAVMAVLAPLGAAQTVTRVATLQAVGLAECEAAVTKGFLAAVAALRGMGLAVGESPTPGLDLTATRMGGFIESAREAAVTFAADRAAGGIGKGFAAMLDFGSGASNEAVAAGEAAMAAAKATMLHVLESADVILMPTAPQVAFAHGRAPVTQADFTALANIAGLPALSLPAGFDDEGMPVAVQLVGRPRSEATLLALAARLDTALGTYRWPADFV